MSLQHFQAKNEKIRRDYLAAKKANPEKFQAGLNLSWSNWGFGMEPLEVSAKRLADSGIKFIDFMATGTAKISAMTPESQLRFSVILELKWAVYAACSARAVTCPATTESSVSGQSTI